MLWMRNIGLTGLVVCLLFGPVCAESLKCEGVVGNSGEQGAWLVKRDTRDHRWIGMGVVQDKHGALWERFSSHGLSRVSPDGRLLGHYRLPDGHEGAFGILTHVGDELVVK